MSNDADAADAAGSEEGSGPNRDPGDVLLPPAGPEEEPTSPGRVRRRAAGAEVQSLDNAAPADGGDDGSSDEWRTPGELHANIRQRYGQFHWDLAATPLNAFCERFITKEENALSVDWCALGGLKWCNPPYSRPNLPLFVPKMRLCVERCQHGGVMLVPATTDTEWWQDTIWGGVDLIEKSSIRRGPLTGHLFRFEGNLCRIEVIHLRGRVAFVGPDGAVAGTGKNGSAVVAFLPKTHRWV